MLLAIANLNLIFGLVLLAATNEVVKTLRQQHDIFRVFACSHVIVANTASQSGDTE